MRVIAGRLGGRLFDDPTGFATHPMSDKARNGIFNALQNLNGQSVLDAFAGSGALSFEAVSRGAKSAIAIEKDYSAYRNLKINTEKLGLEDQVQVVRANCMSWSKTSEEQTFDLVLCDPPYNNWKLTQIERMALHLKQDGILVVSFPTSEDVPVIEGLRLISNKAYGDASVGFWRKV